MNHSIKRNYMYHTAFQILSLITPLVTTPYISRVLEADGIGQYSFAYTLVQYFVFVGNLGFSTYAQIETAKCGDNKRERSQLFWEVVVLRTMTTSICTGLYYLIILIGFKSNITLYLILSGLLISGIFDISWFYYGLEDFRTVTLRNIAVKLAGIAGIFAFVKKKEDLYIYALILTGTNLIGSIVIWFQINDEIERPDWNSLQLKKHLKPAIEFFIPNIATMIYTMLDKTMIGLFAENYSENGYYEQAHKIEQMLVQLLLSISVVMRSRMAYLFKENKIEEIKNKIKDTITFLLFISLPMCFGLMAVAEDLVSWFLGSGFQKCVALIRIFAVLLVIIAISNCISNCYLLVCGKQKKFTIGTYAGAFVNMFMNLILIPRYGSIGAAIASVCGELAILGIFYYYSREYFRLSKFYKNLSVYLFAAAIMVIVVIVIQNGIQLSGFPGLAVQLLFGAFSYFCVLLFLRDSCLQQGIDMIRNKFAR